MTSLPPFLTLWILVEFAGSSDEGILMKWNYMMQYLYLIIVLTKKKNSIRIAQEKCTFQEIRCRKKESSSEVGYFSDRLCVLHRLK